MKTKLILILLLAFTTNCLKAQNKANYQIDMNRIVFHSSFDNYHDNIDYKSTPFYFMNIGTDFGTNRSFLSLRTGFYNQKIQTSERINGDLKFTNASKQRRVYLGLSYYYKWFITDKLIIKSGMSLSWIRAKYYSSYQIFMSDSTNAPYYLRYDRTGNSYLNDLAFGVNNSIQYFVTPSVFINGSIESNLNLMSKINDNISWLNLSIGAGYFFDRNK